MISAGGLFMPGCWNNASPEFCACSTFNRTGAIVVGGTWKPTGDSEVFRTQLHLSISSTVNLTEQVVEVAVSASTSRPISLTSPTRHEPTASP